MVTPKVSHRQKKKKKLPDLYVSLLISLTSKCFDIISVLLLSAQIIHFIHRNIEMLQNLCAFEADLSIQGTRITQVIALSAER